MSKSAYQLFVWSSFRCALFYLRQGVGNWWWIVRGKHLPRDQRKKP